MSRSTDFAQVRSSQASKSHRTTRSLRRSTPISISRLTIRARLSLNSQARVTSVSRRRSSMHITEAKKTMYYRRIPLQGWEQVKQALYIFASGEKRDFKAAQLRLVQDMNTAYGDDALFLMAQHARTAERPNTFVDRMLAEAQSTVAQHGKWKRNYDYDGEGSFFKTSVD